jgi:hypothetical protein
MTLTNAIVVSTLAAGQCVLTLSVVNRVLMQCRDSWHKDLVNLAFGVLMLPAALTALALGRQSQAVQGLVTLNPQTLGAWALMALWAVDLAALGWLAALWVVVAFRGRKPAGLLEISSRAVFDAPRRGFPGLRVTTEALELTELSLTLPNLPDGLDGLQLLHLSDLHCEFAPRVTARAIDVAREIDPDLVAITGDYIVRSAAPLPEICRQLSRLEPPHGVWTIRGNHDIWHGGPAFAETLAKHGLKPLSNRAVDIETGRGRLRLIGVEDPWLRVDDWDALIGTNDGECRIVLSHGPDAFRHIARRGADLTLAGHTHGGQWRAPLLGSLVVPSRHGTVYDCGLFQRRGSLLWVTRGLGCVGVPLRINCPPEMTLLTLRAPRGAAERMETLRESAA